MLHDEGDSAPLQGLALLGQIVIRCLILLHDESPLLGEVSWGVPTDCRSS
jgi:hypothetical protein